MTLACVPAASVPQTSSASGDDARSATIAPDGAITAIWRVEHFEFRHRSTRSVYRCNALRDRLGQILKALGVHESLALDMWCAGTHGRQQIRALISLAAPIEATEENIRAATTFDTRTRLTARLVGFALPTAVHVERFPAEWRRVALGKRGRIDESDCELMRDVQQQIFPRLGIRSAASLHCVPWSTRVTQTLEVEALVRMPAIAAATRPD